MNAHGLLGVPSSAAQEELRDLYERRSEMFEVLIDSSVRQDLRREAQRAKRQLDEAWQALLDSTPSPQDGASAWRPPKDGQCQLCGSTPAAEGRLRSQTAFGHSMSRRENKGFFCRDCGTALANDETARTLVRGWWGFAGFLNPVKVFKNFRALARFKRLDPPTPTPGVFAPLARPMSPVAPPLRRLGVLLTLLGGTAAFTLFLVAGFLGLLDEKVFDPSDPET